MLDLGPSQVPSSARNKPNLKRVKLRFRSNKLKINKNPKSKIPFRYLTASYGLATKMPVGQFVPGPTQEISKIPEQKSFLEQKIILSFFLTYYFQGLSK